MGIRGLNESSSTTAAVAGLNAVLGSNPQGSFATVKARLDAVQTVTDRAPESEALLSAAALAGVRLPDITTFRTTDVPTTLTVPTYDGSNVAVHPSALYFPNGWNGYRYWLAITPYPGSNSALENPSILCSNDGVTFAAPPGVTNPLVPKPGGSGFNSDPCLTLGPDNRMYLFFRDYDATGSSPARERIRVMSSADGVTWTSPVTVVDTADNVQRLVSPTVWFDFATNVWVMLAVDIVSTAVIKRLTSSSPTSGWSAASTISFSPALPGTNPWHIEARPVGDRVVLLVQDGGASAGTLWLMSSSDAGQTFTRSTVAFSSTDAYRSSFYPVVTPAGVSLDIIQGGIGSVMPNIRRATATTDYPAKLVQATLGIAPYVVGDTYARPNSTTGLGNAPTGQAYTALSGTPGILNGQAYSFSNNNTRIVIDSGLADGIFSVEVPVMSSPDQYLIFRAVDASNFWRFGGGGSTYVLQKIVAGSVTNVATKGAVPRSGDILSARCEGSQIRCFVNGWEIFPPSTDSFQSTATLFGWQAGQNVTRFKNLTARSL